ncbi:MAG: hypothetical protein GOMPHAMPRED_005302 [Gomphillus americanus]|uniref:Uncharacterized protein n=1 Tax=Gomphillus americanus TaxID=1940652 RepID=A0A8H3IVZ2_9LECA|nr:MAG: hypothetical protein GOMPHAMPRED_005302 [Gomphillus americanus]
MKVNATFLFLSACAATVFGSEQVLKSTHTVTKTHTKTVATHTLVPTPSGWLPAKSTKNDHPDAQAAAQPAAVKQPKALKKPVTEIPGSEADTGSTNSSSKPSVTTVTKWASTTATVTTTYSSYAACKSTSNYVHNGAADGTSGVDGLQQEVPLNAATSVGRIRPALEVLILPTVHTIRDASITPHTSVEVPKPTIISNTSTGPSTIRIKLCPMVLADLVSTLMLRA